VPINDYVVSLEYAASIMKQQLFYNFINIVLVRAHLPLFHSSFPFSLLPFCVAGVYCSSMLQKCVAAATTQCGNTTESQVTAAMQALLLF
jgi:hypothetical protein